MNENTDPVTFQLGSLPLPIQHSEFILNLFPNITDPKKKRVEEARRKRLRDMEEDMQKKITAALEKRLREWGNI